MSRRVWREWGMLRNMHMSENTWPSTGGRSCIKGFLLSINCMSKISTQSHAYLVSLNPLVTHIVFTKCLWHRFPCNPMCINWSTSTLVSRLLKSMCVRRPSGHSCSIFAALGTLQRKGPRAYNTGRFHGLDV